MNIVLLPNDILYIITKFLSTSDKISVRETCTDFKDCIRFMEIRIETMNDKYDKLINGRNYILSRLRLAALCGLNNYKVAEIWSWVSIFQEPKEDALTILRQLNESIV
jgi:hypothetical protein